MALTYYLTQNYQFFISQWKDCLSDYERIFSSINTYNIIKYLREYWNSRGTNKIRKITRFEKDLVKRLVKIIEQTEPDIRIIESLDNQAAEQFEREAKLISDRNMLDENSINEIDKVISIFHSEQFKKEIFNQIFISPQNESGYLIQCIIRILIEEHSKEFLDTVPAEVFVKYLLQKHNQEIVSLLNHELENNQKIFNYLLEFIRKKFMIETKDIDNFKSEIINGQFSLQLRLGIQHVVNYVIEQLQYNNTVVRVDRKIVLNESFGKLAKRVERYYYHRCFIHLINSIDATRGETIEYINQVLSENYPTYLNNFFDFYNEKIGLTYDILSGRHFSAAILSDIFFDSLIILSKFYPFNVAEFGLKLKSIIDNFCEIELNELIYRSSFRKSLEDFFVTEFDKNLMLLLETARNIDYEIMSDVQTRNMSIHLFLKRLHKQMLKNDKEFDGNYFRKIGNVGQFFCSSLSYGKKKYRVFFSLKGITSNVDKIELDKVKIYNEIWNFHESVTFIRNFTKAEEPLDKFRYKICCDTEFNNRYDALVKAKQICFDALSNISFVYTQAGSGDKKILPYFETYYDITEIPQKRGHMSHEFLLPTELGKELLSSLQDLSKKSANNSFLEKSLTWFREGCYAITEYSEFLFYWLGLETLIGYITRNSNKASLIPLLICINALANENPQYFNRFIQEIGLIEEIGEGIDIGSSIVRIFKFDESTIKTKLLNLLEENYKELNHIFQRQFTISYIYRKRNSIVHEGESFSFEIMGLSKVLQKYFVEMIQPFIRD